MTSNNKLQYPRRLRANEKFEAVVTGRSLQVYATNPKEFNIMQVQGALQYPHDKEGFTTSITHHSAFTCVFSPVTGKYFAIGHSEGKISLFATKTGMLVSQITVASDPAAAGTLNNNNTTPTTGKGLLSSSSSSSAKPPPNISCLQISKNDEFIYFANGAYICVIRIDPDTGELHELGKPQRSSSSTGIFLHLALSPCKNLLSAATMDGTFQLWSIVPQNAEAVARFASPIGLDITSPTTPGVKFRAPNHAARPSPVYTLRGFAGRAVCSVFSPDSSTLFGVSSGDPHIRSWDVKKCVENKKPLRTGHTAWITSIDISPDGKLLATSSKDMYVRFFDIARWEQIEFFKMKVTESSPLKKVLFAPSFSLLTGVVAAAEPAGAAATTNFYFIITLDEKNQITTRNVTESVVVDVANFPQNTEVRSLAIHPLGETIAVTTSRFSQTAFFALSYGRRIFKHVGTPDTDTGGMTPFPTSNNIILKFAFSSDLTQLRVQEDNPKEKVIKSLEIGKVAVHAVANEEKVHVPAARPFGGAAFVMKAETSGGGGGAGMGARIVSVSHDAFEGKVAGTTRAMMEEVMKREEKRSSSARLLEDIAKAGGVSSSSLSGAGASTTSNTTDSVAAFMREFDRKAKARDEAVHTPPPRRHSVEIHNNNRRGAVARNGKDDDDDDDREVKIMESSILVMPEARPFGFKK